MTGFGPAAGLALCSMVLSLLWAFGGPPGDISGAVFCLVAAVLGTVVEVVRRG